MKIHWPRGRYNGRRIVGGKVSIALDLAMFSLSPKASRNHGMPYFIWLGIVLRAETVYR